MLKKRVIKFAHKVYSLYQFFKVQVQLHRAKSIIQTHKGTLNDCLNLVACCQLSQIIKITFIVMHLEVYKPFINRL